MPAARIAWFIMVHHKPAEFEWLMNAIGNSDDLFIVHVDLKSRLGLRAERRGLMREVRRICALYPNVRVMRSRFTNWGGWSLSRTLLDAMALALRIDAGWTHFVNLSGQCYPIKPLATIREEIGAEGDSVMVELRPLDSLPPDDWHLRWHPMIELPVRAIVLPGRRKAPSGFAITHKGSQWVVLPRSFVAWAGRSPLTRTVGRYLKRLLLSDELVIQTLALNGAFRDRVRPYRRHIVWPGPRVLTTADLPALRASDAWFARKFDLARDAGILAALADEIGSAAGPMPGAGEPA